MPALFPLADYWWFYALFTLGVLRLVHEGRGEDAALVFERLVREAGVRLPDAQAEGFHRIGLEHVAMARGGGQGA